MGGGIFGQEQHRMVSASEAGAGGKTSEMVIQKIFDELPVQ